MINTEIKLIIFFAAKYGEALYSQQKQDQELTVAQIMNSLLPNSDWNWRKWGKPLDHSGMTYIKSLMTIHTVEVRKRFKRLGLIECLMNYGQRFMTLYRRQESTPSARKRSAKKSKMAVWGGLTKSCEKKRSKKQRRKGKVYPFKWRFQRIARRDKKAFLSDQCKEIEGNNRVGQTRDLFKKIRDIKATFMKRWAQERTEMVWT